MSMTIEWLATIQHFLPNASTPTLHHFAHSIRLHLPAPPEVENQVVHLAEQIARREAELLMPGEETTDADLEFLLTQAPACSARGSLPGRSR